MPSDWTGPPVVSYVQIAPLLAAHEAGETSGRASPDLGRSAVEVALTADGVVFPDGACLAWEDARRIIEDRNRCYEVTDVGSGTARPVQTYSEETGWVRALMPTSAAPTMLVSGVPMHRIKGTDPMRDTEAKIRTLAPIFGWVLDTCTGLGYTAIAAARTAERVLSIELDPTGLEIARRNPWSLPLFTSPNIELMTGDAAELIGGLADASFSRVIHDPPMVSLGGDLYATAFYRELHRVLRPNGRLFHYIGDPESPSGKRTTAGVIRRLGEAGFSRVVRQSTAFGVTAQR